jgi:serine/threonine-protein kinase
VTADQQSQGGSAGPGPVYGSYRVVSELGRGGMGVVYLAEHTIMGKQAAVKVLLPEYSGREDLVARFFNEARAAARLDHPAFVEVFDCGVTNDCAYMVMEYVAGESLTACLNREGRLPVARSVALARTIAEAMSVAHENGIIHRDLKPDNIILTTGNKISRVGPTPLKILDFGIAKLNLSTGNSNRMTRTGTLMGTPLYMSPEQCRGAATIDGRTDIYALGCILYALLTGTPPFVREGDGVILVAHIVDPVPPLEQHGVSVPPALEATLMKALAKDPADRQSTMAELVAELIAADASPGYETVPGRAAVTTGQRSAAPEAAGAVKPIPAAASPEPPAGAVKVIALAKSSSTTFSRTTGELTMPEAPRKGPAAPPPRRTRLWAGLGTGLVLAVAGSLLFARGGSTPPAPPPQAAAPTPAPPAAPPAPAQVTEVPATPPPRQMELKLITEPPGARVVRTADRLVLGTTPLHVMIDRRDELLELVIEKRGFKSETIQVNLDADYEKTLTLEKRAPRVEIDPDEARKL